MTDKELIRKVHNGNKEALADIINKYYDEIYRFCVYLTGHETDSYDITQEVFLKFIRYVDSYQYKNLKGYLLIIARNLCRDYFRHKNVERKALSTIEFECLLKQTYGCRDEICIEKIVESGKEDIRITTVENELLLKQALQEIPAEQREVIVLRIYEEFKFLDIAKMLGCNLSTVKSRYHLGIKKLNQLLDDNSYV